MDFTCTYMIYQQIKYSPQKPMGLLQPLVPPTQVLENFAMDFITNFPPSHRYITILVVIDHFSEASHFDPLPTQYSAYQVILLFINLVAKLHRMPKNIILDHDPCFLANFGRKYFVWSFSLWVLVLYLAHSHQLDIICIIFNGKCYFKHTKVFLCE